MRLSVALFVAAAFVACKKPEPPAKPQAAEPQAQAPVAGAPAGQQPVRGKIVEKLEAPPYSYLKLQTASGEAWAAVPATPVAVGTEVGVDNAFPMQDFESKTLNRKFQVVYFGTLAGDAAGHGPNDGHDHGAAEPAQAKAGMPPGGMPPPGMGGGMGQADPAQMAAQHKMVAAGPSEVKVQKVEKAKDGKTVSEVYAQKGALKEKNVTVRGQVVKYSAGIMGKNWVHLRDGSGTAEKNDHDLTVTTQDETKVGDVVTVQGTLRLDKDFGAGYAYPVIVEDAKIGK